jgi:hypothetical protein
MKNKTEGISEQGAEGHILTEEGGNSSGLEEIV